jgi:hypothetical protein
MGNLSDMFGAISNRTNHAGTPSTLDIGMAPR